MQDFQGQRGLREEEGEVISQMDGEETWKNQGGQYMTGHRLVEMD